jgi:transposase
MSRRLRTLSVRALKDRVEALINPSCQPALVGVMDGKALPIPLHSRDRQSGKGRGVGNIARGYKIHTVVDAAGRLLTWRLASLNVDERVMAARLLRDMPQCAYVVADSHYDSNSLFEAAARRGMQLVVPRRYGKDKGLGHRRYHEARLRSKALLEENASAFGVELLRHRRTIERVFACLTNFAGGLTGLPPWVRGYHRVRAWVQAKIILAHLKRATRNALAA